MTYSIVARDAQTGEIGVAVQTALPGVGRLCPWAEAGIGAVATQALVRVSHGPSGLALLRSGHDARHVLAALVASDSGASIRQLGVVDTQGFAAAHTGKDAIRYAGHHVGEGYAVQANMMLHEGVPQAMSAAYEAAAHLPLVLRLVEALAAAQAAGGDFRGQQSAALKIVSGDLPRGAWDGVAYDVRVDDHATPVDELRRICQRFYAYTLVDEAEALVRSGDFDGAMAKVAAARAQDDSETQLYFWFAVQLADETGRLDLAEPILREVFRRDAMWMECVRRYADAHPLRTEGLVDTLLAFGAGGSHAGGSRTAPTK